MVSPAHKPSRTFPRLFSPFSIGSLGLRNRIVALPIHTGFACPDGKVSPWMKDWYGKLAATGAAMVVVANAAVSPDGVVTSHNLRVDRDDQIQGLSKLAAAIKAQGALACIQLNHAGRFAKTPKPLLPSPIIASNLAFNVESLKEFMEFFPFEQRFRLTRHLYSQVRTWGAAMTDQERDRVVQDFAAAATRAWQAGFDLVELHGANGYLICQHLSPFTHKTAGRDGDGWLLRSAFLRAVIRAVRERLPPGVPVGFRLLLEEWVPGGIDLNQALVVAGLLEEEGVAYLSVSAGTYNSLFSPEILKRTARPAYLEKEAAALRQKVGIPVVMAGRITTPERAERLLKEGAADLIGLGRPLRADPQWIQKATDPGQKIRPCINCNHCLTQVILEKGFVCTQWPKSDQKKTWLAHKLLTRQAPPLWVIADPGDVTVFKSAIALAAPKTSEQVRPTLLFLAPMANDPACQEIREAFLAWIEASLDPLGILAPIKTYPLFDPELGFEKAVLQEIGHGNYGQVVWAQKDDQPWRQHLLYRIKGRVLTQLGTAPNRERVLVPVDLSQTTLLIMGQLCATLARDPGFSLDFIHVETSDPGQAERRFEAFKSIAGLPDKTSLILMKGTRDVPLALARFILEGRYGTVVMGKRGISQIKRWLLGSVSAGVLKHLSGQSLILID